MKFIVWHYFKTKTILFPRQGPPWGGEANRASQTHWSADETDVQTHFPFWCLFTFSFAHSPNYYPISSSQSTWAIRGLAFTQTYPQQWLHASEHFIPCFGQLHLIVLQSVVQLQWMIFKSSRGQEAGQWVWGRTLPLQCSIPTILAGNHNLFLSTGTLADLEKDLVAVVFCC